MATCLSQLYHEYKRGICAGYAKFETFPIWNIPLKHPVNLAYEAATADLNDVNMIDPFHLEAYGETTVNYNRDVEIFPVLQAMFEKIMGNCPYKSPTDMGVNMAGNCIIDDEICREASRQEIIRRYYKSCAAFVSGEGKEEEVRKIELLLKQAHASLEDRKVVPVSLEIEKKTGGPRRGSGTTRRTDRTRKDLRPSGRFRRPSSERAEGSGRDRSRTSCDLPRSHSSYPGTEDKIPGKQESPSSF